MPSRIDLELPISFALISSARCQIDSIRKAEFWLFSIHIQSIACQWLVKPRAAMVTAAPPMRLFSIATKEAKPLNSEYLQMGDLSSIDHVFNTSIDASNNTRFTQGFRRKSSHKRSVADARSSGSQRSSRCANLMNISFSSPFSFPSRVQID